MKFLISIVGVLFLTSSQSYSQGRIFLSLSLSPTHVGSIDGPRAGPGIWGQFLVGENLNELMPLADSIEHHGNGHFRSFEAIVPNIPPGNYAFVQFLAWDGTVWGTDFSLVPENQFGRTDAVLYGLGNGNFPAGVPLFTQSAVVPPVPEPSTWALMVLGLTVLMAVGGRRRLNRS
jgi:hypothetical protein